MLLENNIKNAYRQSKNIYDDVLTRNKWWSKLYIDFFWGVDDLEIAEELLDWVPNDFSGKLLDIPVGTGVFTAEKYKRIPDAHITAVDYSEDMLEQASKRFKGMNLNHVKCSQGDVCHLQFEDESFDLVLSMNGFHVFPDKLKAFDETMRVLKKGGKFIATFYIEGENNRTDFIVNHMLKRKGWFNGPFQNKKMIKEILEERCEKVNIITKKAMVMIYCIK